ncbi:retrovirus-related pol polyprotein from transposon TNT 1-94, partial [Tanacetum coccineum]
VAGRQNITHAGNGLVQQIDENDQIVQRVPRTESNLGKANVQCYNCNARGHYARDCPKPKVRDTRYFREHMLLAMKDEAGGTLNAVENDFMLDNAYGDYTLEELTTTVIMMERIQPTDDKGDDEPKYDVDAASKVNAWQISLISGMHSIGVHEHTNHAKLKTVINTSDDDQIDSNIIFYDPYVENTGGTNKNDSNSHDQYLIFNPWQKTLLQKELETCKKLIKTLEKKPVHFSKYKEAYEELEREIRVDKDTIDRILKENDKIEGDNFKMENENVIRYETELSKKAFKERENKYLDDIVDLE